ncbi:unnamed protein product [Pedinophyceae sp. YPF-701]|nr:unnamed protein product [Pedinophyceae sp. YPF-701]
MAARLRVVPPLRWCIAALVLLAAVWRPAAGSAVPARPDAARRRLAAPVVVRTATLDFSFRRFFGPVRAEFEALAHERTAPFAAAPGCLAKLTSDANRVAVTVGCTDGDRVDRACAAFRAEVANGTLQARADDLVHGMEGEGFLDLRGDGAEREHARRRRGRGLSVHQVVVLVRSECLEADTLDMPDDSGATALDTPLQRDYGRVEVVVEGEAADAGGAAEALRTRVRELAGAALAAGGPLPPEAVAVTVLQATTVARARFGVNVTARTAAEAGLIADAVAGAGGVADAGAPAGLSPPRSATVAFALTSNETVSAALDRQALATTGLLPNGEEPQVYGRVVLHMRATAATATAPRRTDAAAPGDVQAFLVAQLQASLGAPFPPASVRVVSGTSATREVLNATTLQANEATYTAAVSAASPGDATVLVNFANGLPTAAQTEAMRRYGIAALSLRTEVRIGGARRAGLAGAVAVVAALLLLLLLLP